MACAGNSAETCGGNLRLDLYEYTGWIPLGCYTDNVNARTLSDYVIVSGGQSATTIESCQAACKAAGYSLAGVEYANECCKFPLSIASCFSLLSNPATNLTLPSLR